ncbi:MAG: hypothetical protein ACXVDA_14955 [Ktedonobacterales bacterium]
MEQEGCEGDEVQADQHCRHPPPHLVVDDWLGLAQDAAQIMRHPRPARAGLHDVAQAIGPLAQRVFARWLMSSSSRGK